MFFLPRLNTVVKAPSLSKKCFQIFRLYMIGKGIVKGIDVFIFHITGDMIAYRHLNDDTSILLQRFWTVRFVISFQGVL